MAQHVQRQVRLLTQLQQHLTARITQILRKKPSRLSVISMVNQHGTGQRVRTTLTQQQQHLHVQMMRNM